ncbi:unnamed protein product [Paramecium sonneborni]|uniref:Uncharacterized protein n=1 Tax=Paramecium sonneborni TaxID=65129 RepID=A0A8S1RNA5_9CILI|nr:unnamed protein product [Paramecium sonneborni]
MYKAVGDPTIKKEIRRLESGQNYMKHFLILNKLLIMVNIIRLVRRQGDGILWIVHMIRKINKCKYYCFIKIIKYIQWWWITQIRENLDFQILQKILFT